MAIASLHLFFFIFISLSHFPLSILSIYHSSSPSWCPTLASNNNKDCRLESRSTPIASLDVGQGVIPRRQEYDVKNDSLRKAVDSRIKKVHGRDEESTNSEPPAKAPRREDQSGGQSLHPAPTQQETKDGEKEASGDLSVNVGLEIMEDGEYVLKIKKIIPNSTHDGSEVERAKQMAQNAALLLIHGKMLQEMGEKLLQQSQASLRSLFKK